MQFIVISKILLFQSLLSKVEADIAYVIRRGFDLTLLMFPSYMPIHPKVASIMSDARKTADNRFELSMEYTCADGKVSKGIIWPLGLFF